MESLVNYLINIPPGTDPNDWQHRATMLYKTGDVALWGNACLAASQEADSPTDKAFLLLEAVNGLRRQTGFWNVQQVSELLNQTKILADQAANQRLKNRVLELWAYHGALVYHSAGKFSEAAECHRQAAAFAAEKGDEKGQLNGKYMSTYELLHQELSKIPGIVPYKQAKKALSDFLLTSFQYQASLHARNAESQRWFANIVCHRVMFDWLVNGGIGDLLLQGMNTIRNKIPAGQEPAFASALIAIEAMESFYEEKDQAAIDIAATMPKDASPDWRPAAMLVSALALHRLGDSKTARKRLGEITAIPTQEVGGHLWARLARAHINTLFD